MNIFKLATQPESVMSLHITVNWQYTYMFTKLNIQKLLPRRVNVMILSEMMQNLCSHVILKKSTLVERLFLMKKRKK